MDSNRLLILGICVFMVACQAGAVTPPPASCAPSASATSVGTAAARHANSATWLNAYGGNYDQEVASVAPLGEEGIVFAGWSEFQSTAERHQDAWVVRLDAEGKPLWSKIYGGAQDDSASAVLATPDGCLVVGGFSASAEGGAWVFKINREGALLWSKNFGLRFQFGVTNLALTPEGGILVLGRTNHASFPTSDAWIAELDKDGNLLWSRIVGGAGGDALVAVAPTSEGYLLSGYTMSLGEGQADVWLVRLDNTGGIVWSKTYGGPGMDTASAIISSEDGGFVIAGSTNTVDALLFRIDGRGNVNWARALEWNALNSLDTLAQGTAGDYVAAGSSHASGTPSAPWLVGLTEEGAVRWSKAYRGIEDSTGTTVQRTGADRYLIAGGAGVSSHSAWVMQTDANGELREGCDLAQIVEVQSTEMELRSSEATMPTSIGELPAIAAASDVVVRESESVVDRLCEP